MSVLVVTSLSSEHHQSLPRGNDVESDDDESESRPVMVDRSNGIDVMDKS
jgi:hypothetical protein